jgi:short-subunit dehydrogenase
MAGRLAVPGLAVYCATKFGVMGLTDTLREEYRGRGIHFTSILPSKVTTELSSGTDEAAGRIPAVSPEQVADAVVHALQKRLPEVAVPGYLGAINGLQGIAPHWLLRGIRHAFGDQAILKGLDEQARANYTRRINGLVKKS